MAGLGGYRPGAGRPKAAHTIQAEKAKAELIRRFLEEQKPIFDALLKKAKQGDLQAIRELFERVWGKESQPFEGALTQTFDVTDELYQAILSREAKRNSSKDSR